MKVLIVTRDLKHGEGHHVMNLLKVLKVSPMVDKVHILAPGKFPIESDKFSYNFFNPLGNTFVTRQPHSATKTPDN